MSLTRSTITFLRPEYTGRPGAVCNAVIGCIKCEANCWAIKRAAQLARNPQFTRELRGLYEVFAPGTFIPERLEALKTKTPHTVFMSSMGDLFHPEVSGEVVAAVLRACLTNDQHVYIFLTKYPAQMHRHMDFLIRLFNYRYPRLPKNWYLGTSITDQPTADERLDHLLDINSRNLFINIEPMLGPIDLNRNYNGGQFFGDRLAQVIVGGESGTDARPMHYDWPRSIRNPCAGAGIPFMFKQWGEWISNGYVALGEGLPVHKWPDGDFSQRIGKRKAGHLLDGKEHMALAWADAEGIWRYRYEQELYRLCQDKKLAKLSAAAAEYRPDEDPEEWAQEEVSNWDPA